STHTSGQQLTGRGKGSRADNRSAKIQVEQIPELGCMHGSKRTGARVIKFVQIRGNRLREQQARCFGAARESGIAVRGTGWLDWICRTGAARIMRDDLVGGFASRKGDAEDRQLTPNLSNCRRNKEPAFVTVGALDDWHTVDVSREEGRNRRLRHYLAVHCHFIEGVNPMRQHTGDSRG